MHLLSITSYYQRTCSIDESSYGHTRPFIRNSSFDPDQTIICDLVSPESKDHTLKHSSSPSHEVWVISSFGLGECIKRFFQILDKALLKILIGIFWII